MARTATPVMMEKAASCAFPRWRCGLREGQRFALGRDPLRCEDEATMGITGYVVCRAGPGCGQFANSPATACRNSRRCL